MVLQCKKANGLMGFNHIIVFYEHKEKNLDLPIGLPQK